MNPLSLVMRLPAILLAITVHEYGHGRAARSLGDPTAELSGRITLNPFKHLDPMGFLCLLLAGFGWAKPVPVNAAYFQDPVKGMMLTSVAGPMANLTTAAAGGIILRMSDLGGGLLSTLVALAVFYNVALALFNLLPIHPLDGSHILKGLLPAEMALRFSRYDRIVMYGLFAVILMDVLFRTRILGYLLLRPIFEVFYLIGGQEGMVALWRVFEL